MQIYLIASEVILKVSSYSNDVSILLFFRDLVLGFSFHWKLMYLKFH